MRGIKDLLRLSAAGRSQREIARALGLANGTVSGYLTRARRAGVVWPQAAEWDDAALERALFPPPPDVPAETRRWPDLAWVHRELKRKGVTLFLLWEEYKAAHPDGFGYSWFCQHYQAFVGKVDVVMRQTHRAGEATFVDCAGHTVGVVERQTGEERQAQVFVAVLGASNYTYAEATWTQGLADRNAAPAALAPGTCAPSCGPDPCALQSPRSIAPGGATHESRTTPHCRSTACPRW